MKPTLKKDYFSVPKGTVINVIIKGTNYLLQNAKTGDIFAILNEKEKEEYVQY
jgi:hypothetical protein